MHVRILGESIYGADREAPATVCICRLSYQALNCLREVSSLVRTLHRNRHKTNGPLCPLPLPLSTTGKYDRLLLVVDTESICLAMTWLK